jgi:hypothetical protein
MKRPYSKLATLDSGFNKMHCGASQDLFCSSQVKTNDVRVRPKCELKGVASQSIFKIGLAVSKRY